MKKKPIIDNYIKAIFRIDCGFCDDFLYMDTDDEVFYSEQAAVLAVTKGWKVVVSKKWNCIAAACPACARKKDKNR